VSQISDVVVVPDITAPDAYKEAVKGVKYIIHVASPTFPASSIQNFEDDVIKPAVSGTLSMLEAAAKESGVERLVITSSVLAVASFPELLSGETIDGISIC
jgi:nucleoside-diphosphate-sugar epimerase